MMDPEVEAASERLVDLISEDAMAIVHCFSQMRGITFTKEELDLVMTGIYAGGGMTTTFFAERGWLNQDKMLTDLEAEVQK